MPFARLDRFILTVDRALRTVTAQAHSARPYPAQLCAADQLNQAQQRHSAALMRINHVGEICAQALYDAQSAFSHTPQVAQQLQHSCREEEDHLAWTAERLKELNSHTSLMNPLWYAGAYACGVIAARCGDAASLGFVVETERQVEAHLAGHLHDLPAADLRSRAIVEQMRLDEVAHGAAAAALGASSMPAAVRLAMQAMSKVMTGTAYYI